MKFSSCIPFPMDRVQARTLQMTHSLPWQWSHTKKKKKRKKVLQWADLCFFRVFHYLFLLLSLSVFFSLALSRWCLCAAGSVIHDSCHHSRSLSLLLWQLFIVTNSEKIMNEWSLLSSPLSPYLCLFFCRWHDNHYCLCLKVPPLVASLFDSFEASCSL